ncbi:MAG: hypothetical protein QM809_16520 [Gordonia sp. (in: high G+C Gram-positive bacteria)]|uniref:hypothetical protein n=1 Tax=Gordonia sp. (in: high G+C Gram-positive bacteria) TaxID=84139 RepID=UPI0039E564F1
MKKSLKRTVAALAAGVVGAGALLAPAPATAAAPGDLQILGGAVCTFGAWPGNPLPLWQTRRTLGVKNTGGTPLTGVRVTRVGGTAKTVRVDGDRPGVLKPGTSSITHSIRTKGCRPGTSILGYAQAAQAENPLNNAGFWVNWKDALPESS